MTTRTQSSLVSRREQFYAMKNICSVMINDPTSPTNDFEVTFEKSRLFEEISDFVFLNEKL
jgi:hypothetical protein